MVGPLPRLRTPRHAKRHSPRSARETPGAASVIAEATGHRARFGSTGRAIGRADSTTGKAAAPPTREPESWSSHSARSGTSRSARGRAPRSARCTSSAPSRVHRDLVPEQPLRRLRLQRVAQVPRLRSRGGQRVRGAVHTRLRRSGARDRGLGAPLPDAPSRGGESATRTGRASVVGRSHARLDCETAVGAYVACATPTLIEFRGDSSHTCGLQGSDLLSHSWR